jgi:imidazolonepropionase-like amidohydrolase
MVIAQIHLVKLATNLETGWEDQPATLASTRHAAYVCGHGDELGTLKPGKLADLIAVAGDPLTEM